MDVILTGLWEGFLGKKNAQIILSCVKALQEYLKTETVETTMVVRVLTGDKDEKIQSRILQKTLFYGALKGKYSRSELRKCISYLIERGYLRGSVNGVITASSKKEPPYLSLEIETPYKYNSKNKYKSTKKKTKKESSKEETEELYRTPEMEQDDRLIRIAEDKLGFRENTLEGMVGCVSFEKSRLYWFYLEGNYGTEYYPVEFTRHSSQCTTYCCTPQATKIFEGIYRVDWKKGCCFLISLPECKYIKLITTKNEIYYPTAQFPYILYTETLFIQCSFLDEKKNKII